MVEPNGPGPDSTNWSCPDAKVIFMVQGFVEVNVVDPTVAETPPAGTLYVAEVAVDEVGVADSLIITEALADSPAAPRQSGPEIKLAVPATVIVKVVSDVASCAGSGAKPRVSAVAMNKKFTVCFNLFPSEYCAAVAAAAYSVGSNPSESKRV